MINQTDGSSLQTYLLRASAREAAKGREHPVTYCTCGQAKFSVPVDHAIYCALTVERRELLVAAHEQAYSADVLIKLRANLARHEECDLRRTKKRAPSNRGRF